MTENSPQKQTWFITGAGRGMGVHFAKTALAAGHNVVATGRNPDAVAQAVGDSDDLLVVKLDVTSTQDAEAAVKAAVDRFGRIDVLVNNAASFYAGYFEELTPEQMDGSLRRASSVQVAQFQEEINAFREVSSSLALDEAAAGSSVNGGTLS
jgi:NAD(P)-dependent dehydrogenase (short-subunit alcohol dehydrogenase family)